MNPAFVGSIFMTAATFAPSGWALCDGRQLSISENEVLYVLLGTTYGGDGVNTFNLPDLRGRAAINQGQGPGLSNYLMGQKAGNENVTMVSANMPAHTHLINVGSANGTTNTPANNLFLTAAVVDTAAETIYSTNASNATLASSSISISGSSIPFSIVKPILAVNYILSLFGIFPSRN